MLAVVVLAGRGWTEAASEDGAPNSACGSSVSSLAVSDLCSVAYLALNWFISEHLGCVSPSL